MYDRLLLNSIKYLDWKQCKKVFKFDNNFCKIYIDEIYNIYLTKRFKVNCLDDLKINKIYSENKLDILNSIFSSQEQVNKYLNLLLLGVDQLTKMNTQLIPFIKIDTRTVTLILEYIESELFLVNDPEKIIALHALSLNDRKLDKLYQFVKEEEEEELRNSIVSILNKSVNSPHLSLLHCKTIYKMYCKYGFNSNHEDLTLFNTIRLRSQSTCF